jgi:uncharacterized protein YbcI
MSGGLYLDDVKDQNKIDQAMKNDQLKLDGCKPDSKKMSTQQRRQLQHEIKVYMEKYFKKSLGKGVDQTKIIIWHDMLIIRGEKFLTEPEKFIVKTPAGRDVVKAARMHVAKQHSIDNMPYFEEKFGAKCIHQTYDIESENDYWIHVMVFNRVFTED